jgi:hypothetical protein
MHKLALALVFLLAWSSAVITGANSDSSGGNSKFNPGDIIWSIADIKVRSSPGMDSVQINSLADGNSIIKGCKGKIIDGPTEKDGYNWWKIDYDLGITGWSAENYIELAPDGPEAPDDFSQWSENAIEWATSEDRIGSRSWNGECLRFVSNSFRQKDVDGQSGWSTATDAARSLYRFDQQNGSWRNAPRGAVIFFNGKGNNPAGHVGIYLGDGENIINAYGTVMEITIDEATEKVDVGEYIGWSYPPVAWRPDPSEINMTSHFTEGSQVSDSDQQATATEDKVPDDGRNTVARVIFAEAGPSCSDEERELIASVMLGRINHPGFGNGNLNTMYQVATQPGAFSCINDPKNENWAKSSDISKLNDAEIDAWNQCFDLASGDFQPLHGLSERPLVYYHDKSIETPSSWDNQYWSAVKELETDHFIFYSVTEASDETNLQEEPTSSSAESSSRDTTVCSLQINESIGGFQIKLPARDDATMVACIWGGSSLLEGNNPIYPSFTTTLSTPDEVYIMAAINAEQLGNGCIILVFGEQQDASAENIQEFIDFGGASYIRLNDLDIDGRNAIILKRDDNSEYVAAYWLDESASMASKLVILISTEQQEDAVRRLFNAAQVSEIEGK